MFQGKEKLIKKRDHLNVLIEKRSSVEIKKPNGKFMRKSALLGWLGVTMMVDRKTREGVMTSIANYLPNHEDQKLFSDVKPAESKPIKAAS